MTKNSKEDKNLMEKVIALAKQRAAQFDFSLDMALGEPRLFEKLPF